MSIRVLGPMEVEAAGGVADLGGRRPRMVLAALLVRHPAAVSPEQLIDAVWAGVPTPGVASTLRSYVSGLRRALEPDGAPIGGSVLRMTAAGYALDLPVGTIDAQRFEVLVGEGRKARDGGDTTAAVAHFRAALALWRGDAYQDLPYTDFARIEADRLEDLRLGCLEEAFDLELAVGRHADIVGEVDAHSRENPLRERALGLRMVALYRCGRQAEALRAYEEGRLRLLEELGVDPSPALQRRYERILHHDDDVPVAISGAPAKRRTLTFLFGDVEGSTQKLRLLGEDYAEELERARREVGEAVHGNRGRELRLWGDGFFATFDSASDAVSAAVTAQAGLATAGHPFTIRMGIHSGDATWANDEYVGLAVHVAARIHEAGHGGQILVSQPTKDLLESDEHGDVDLVDLGLYRLKDVPDPVRLHQAVADGLRADFPHLRARAVRRHNVPSPATSFVGREDELADLAAALESGSVITLTGVGGVGKTRLAIEVGTRTANRFSDGVWLCELAPLSSGEEIVDVTARVLGVQPAGGRSLRDGIVTALHERDLLLILDNCEHVLVSTAALVDDIVRTGPAAVVLATSREPLGADGERVWPVRSLAVPDPDAAVTAGAVRLFEDRARAVRPDFAVDDGNRAAVTDICHRVDGIPLAVELAAARTASMSPAQISDRLQEDFTLLRSGRRGTVDRHRTLHAAIEWSYTMLPSAEQTLFNRLSVFAGGFTVTDAAAVCGTGLVDDILEGLAGLVDRSMVTATVRGPEARYSLLETMREFARDHLTPTGEVEHILQAHSRHYVARAQQMAELRWGPRERDAERWFDTEDGNLRAAATWMVSAGDLELLLRLIESSYTVARRGPTEIYDWAGAAASMSGAARHPMRPFLLYVASEGAWHEGDLSRAAELAREALAAVEDRSDPLRAFGLVALGIVAMFEGRLGEARRLCREAMGLAEQLRGNLFRYAPVQVATVLALAEAYDGNTDASLALVERCEAAATETRSSALRIAALYGRGEALLEVDPERALDALETCVELCRELDYRFHYGVALNSAASLRSRHGEPARALWLFKELVEHWRTAGNRLQQWTALRNLAELLARVGAAEDALVLLAAAEASLTAPALFGAHADRLAQIEGELEALLGDGTVTGARERGARLSDAEAVAYALAAIGRALDRTAHAG